MHTNKDHAYLRRFGTRSTQLIALLCGDIFPFYYVSEFPRSGGTWLSYMVSEYLDIPKPHQPLFTVLRSSVIQNHWGYSERLKRAIYLHRDGRDVCISHFYYVLRGLNDESSGVRDYYTTRFPEITEAHGGLELNSQHLPQFIEKWAERPIGCRIPWGEHVTPWVAEGTHCINVSYEDLNLDGMKTLTKVLEALTGEKVDRQRLQSIMDNHSFEKRSGRSPGTEDKTSFMRKGIVGDWKNYFNRESGEIFNHHFGDVLLQLGYEESTNWCAKLPDRL